MNSRRRMKVPSDKAHNLTHHWTMRALCIAAKSSRLMSVQGQTLPSRDFCGTAALPPKPDIGWRGWHVRKVPFPDSCPAQKSEETVRDYEKGISLRESMAARLIVCPVVFRSVLQKTLTVARGNWPGRESGAVG